MVASGFLAIAGGFLIASVGSWRVFGGGVLGILGSILGALMSLALLTTTVGLSQNIAGFGPTAQYSVSYEILFIGCIAAMFMGFPLGMYGSMAGIVGEEAEQPSQAAEAT